uniref:Putative secreted peptide n=1 Tax=Anopheles braziliensis TaxID=58242 RepID=A0A2M3ZPP1_9DIPT
MLAVSILRSVAGAVSVIVVDGVIARAGTDAGTLQLTCTAADAHRSVKDELRYLTALHTGTVGALGRALELECDRTDADFAHALLAKEA